MQAVETTTMLNSVTSSRLVRTLVAGSLAALLAGCATDAPQDTWQPKGPNSQMINDLDWVVFSIAGVVGVVVFSVLAFALWKYRDRGQPIPEQTHGKPALEIGLTILPALILVGIAIPTVGTIMDLAETSDTECIVNVTGQQWWWEIDYPVQDGCGGIDEPIVTSGQMVIEAGTKVLVRGTSRDVIHSWWIPSLNGKRDMVPGRIHTVRLEADEPGIFAGQCTEFCGLSHANMRMEVIAMNSADFEIWKANQVQDYVAPVAGSLAAEGESAFISQCSRCHQVDGLTDSSDELIISRPDQNVWSGAAPNLTNLMTRNTF
ncbi:MAG: cytochrome c oxidase subunit 2, partial [Candidatus Azotimanducaceae bacterium]